MKAQFVRLSTHQPCCHAFTLIPVLLLLWLAADPIRAAVKTWDGSSATSGYWMTGDNWVGNSPPNAGDSLVFPASALRASNTNNFPSNTAFSSLTINSNAYKIYGNSLALTGGITGDYGASFYPDIRLDADQTFTATTPGWSLSLAGDVNLNGHNLTLSGAGRHELTGVISGAGNVTKTGSGTTIFGGVENNTYTGTTTVNQGTLQLNKFVGLAVWGDLVIGDGSGGVGADVVNMASSDQIANWSDVTINSSGLFTMGGDDTIHTLTLNGGADLDTGMQTLSLGGSGGVTVNSPGADSTLAGKLDATSGAFCIFDVNEGAFHLTARLSGDVDLVKTGGGAMYMTASNTFTGEFTVDQDVLAISHPWALGSAGAGTIVTNTGVLTLNADSLGVSGEPLILAPSGSSTVALLALVGSNWWGGPVTLTGNARIATFLDDTTLNITAPIGGDGGLVKISPGTLILSGTGGNTYAGDTRVNDGTLELARDIASGATIRYGTLFIGDGQGGAKADVVRYTDHDQIWSSVPIIITNSGWLDLNGNTDIIGAMTFSGGRASSGASGLITLIGDVTTLASASNAPAIEGRLSLSGVRRFTVANTSFSPDLNLFATLSGSGGIIKEGNGALGIYSNNVFSGTVTVNDGLLYFYDDNGLGSTTGGTVVNSGGVLVPANGVHVGLEGLSLSGNGDGIAGALASIGGSNSWAGTVTLAADATISVQTNRVLSLTGIMTGPGGFKKTQAGTLLFSGTNANTFSGTAYVADGTLDLDGSGAINTIPGALIIGDGIGGANADVVRLLAGSHIANSARVTIASSGVLELVGSNDAIGSLSGSGAVHLGGYQLALGYSGETTVYAGIISGTGGRLSKWGGGTFTLSGDNTYSGLTTVGAGTLLVNGSQPASPVSLSTDATLGGTGRVGSITSSGGIISPGLSPGTLASANVVLAAGSTLKAELAGLAPGSGHDQLSVQGLVQLTDVALEVSLPAAPAMNDKFVILANDGAELVSGQFTGLPEGAEFAAAGARFKISYVGDTGNDVVLKVVQAPAALRITSITTADTNVAVAWTGGSPNYVVEKKAALTNATWEPVTAASSETNALLPMDTARGFFRVLGNQ